MSSAQRVCLFLFLTVYFERINSQLDYLDYIEDVTTKKNDGGAKNRQQQNFQVQESGGSFQSSGKFYSTVYAKNERLSE